MPRPSKNTIPTEIMRRTLKAAGAKRISTGAAEKLGEVTDEYSIKVAQLSVDLMKNDNTKRYKRTTILEKDVKLANKMIGK